MEFTLFSIFLAFSAGLLSFISPCVLPLVPSYVSYITGLTFEDITANKERARVRVKTITHSIAFGAGFTSIFVLFGASATFIGQILLNYQEVIRKIGGILIILFGLYLLRILKLNFLSSEMKIHVKNRPVGYLRSFVVGMVFATGWTPCIGPILGSILIFASTTGSVAKGMGLLATYSLGLGLPFFISSIALNEFLSSFKIISRYMMWITILSGAFLIVIGVMLFTDSFTLLTSWFQKYGIGWDFDF